MKFFLSIIILFFIVLNLFAQVIEAPVISKESGFYTNEFNVEIFHNKGAVILYTLDGSDPTMENIDGVEWSYKRISHNRDNFENYFMIRYGLMNIRHQFLSKAKEIRKDFFHLYQLPCLTMQIGEKNYSLILKLFSKEWF